MNAFVVFAGLMMGFLTVQAQETQIRQGNHPQIQVSVADIARQVHPGDIVVMGENHGLKTAQAAQVQLLQALRDAGLKVTTALEFFYYPQQSLVDAYRQGTLGETDFLKQLQWGLPSFDFYRAQATFPRYDQGERTLAINAPRTLTGKIAKGGLESLTSEEQKMLPPQFHLGRDSYKKRFLEDMPHLPSPDAGDRYFAAQSTWDDTMAWKVTEYSAQHPDQVVVITVGDFHAQYGGGLPDRIEARRGAKPLVFSYVNASGLSDEDVQAQLNPSPEYGPRADFIWLAHEPNASSPN